MTSETRFDLADLDGPAWLRLDGGSFEMGSENGRDDERPVHEVRLSPFRISRYPVTNAQYTAFVGEANVAPPEDWPDGGIPEEKADHPVAFVSWDDAQAFCRWLTEKVGEGSEGSAHLPTEAQWEFTARGTERREYPWGADAPTPEHANYQESGIGDTTPVGSHQAGATPDGIHDLAGNVRQWCQDWYHRYPDASREDPTGPDEGKERVLRGGSFLDAPGTLRGSYRFNVAADSRFGFVGFRAVWS